VIVPFYRPWILDEDVDRVVNVLRSGWLTSGPCCEDVETELRNLTGAKHALVMSSCTAALHTAVAYHRPKSHALIIVPDFTFAATATAVVNAGAVPLLCDVELESGGLNPVAVEVLLRAHPNVIGVVAVHYAGIPCDTIKLRELARHFDVFLVEDAAHALGSAHPNGTKVGAASRDGVALSFYATKNATSGEGGALLTDDDELAQFARQFRYHGLTRIAWEREGSPLPFDATYDIETAGFKYNLSDVAAGLLLGQLRRFEEGQRRRREIAERYVAAFSQLPVHCMGAGVPGHAWHLFVLRSNRARELSKYLFDRGIGTQRHYRPLHELTFLRDDPSRFPNSSRLSSSVISLPLYPDLSEAEQSYVIDNVEEFFRG
jgi:dTDP-4-amino-4,6-dideoxygalactose transaminase